MADGKTLGQLAVDVEAAQRQYKTADEKYREAGRYRSGCVNVLNDTQKAFDVELKRIRDSASTDSDWGRARLDGRS